MTEKTEAEPTAAERDAAHAARLTAISTELGKVSGQPLTLPDAYVFRQREIAAAALAGAAEKTAQTIAGVAAAAPVLVSGRTDQAQSVLAARAFLAAVASLRTAARALLDRDLGGLNLRPVVAPEEAEEPEAVPTDPVAAAAALAVAALNLLAVEVTLTASSGTATEIETHVPVLHHLLARQIPVLHSSLGIPADENRVITAFAELAPLAARLVALSAAADDAIARLGKDPPADQLEPLVAAKTGAAALSATIISFVAAAVATDPGTGSSPLIVAASADQMIAGPDAEASYVAVVHPARTDAHQVSLKRRLLAPRLVVSASATIDVVVLDLKDGRIAAAATHTDARSFQVRFPMWFNPWGRPQLSNPRYTALPGPPLFEEPPASATAGALRPAPVSLAPEADLQALRT